VSFLGIPLKVFFVLNMLAFSACRLTNSKSFPSPVEFFIIFFLQTVIALFYFSLLEEHLRNTFDYTLNILKSNDLAFFKPDRRLGKFALFLVNPLGVEPRT